MGPKHDAFPAPAVRAEEMGSRGRGPATAYERPSRLPTHHHGANLTLYVPCSRCGLLASLLGCPPNCWGLGPSEPRGSSRTDPYLKASISSWRKDQTPEPRAEGPRERGRRRHSATTCHRFPTRPLRRGHAPDGTVLKAACCLHCHSRQEATRTEYLLGTGTGPQAEGAPQSLRFPEWKVT